MLTPSQLIDIYLLGRNRLGSIELVALGASVSDVVALYGEPRESTPTEESADVTHHVFPVGNCHELVALEWRGAMRSLTYWSIRPSPARDLQCMLDFYADGSKWRVLEQGYWYQREDGVAKLWCSAAPAIGVAYVEFLNAQAEYKTVHAIEQLKSLTDVTWAPNRAVFELQKQFIDKGGAGLFEFAACSDNIAASPDGRHVFIVREHRACDVEGGFTALNAPPKTDSGNSTQAINYFVDGQLWTASSLPRDANVDVIRFEEDQCILKIRQIGSGRVLTVTDSPKAIRRRLGRISIMERYRDAELWELLEEASD